MKKASIGVRAGIYLIDRVVIYLPFSCIYVVYLSPLVFGDTTGAGFVLGIISLIPNTFGFASVVLAGNDIIITLLNIMLISLTLALLFICMELIFKGRTFGQKTIRVQVVTKDGEQPTFVRRVVRNFVKAIGMALYPISLVYYIIKRETPWDTVTKTMVIEKENKKLP